MNLPSAEIRNDTETPLLFLSHSSKDTLFSHALEKFIVGLGVTDKQLVYTSHPKHQIPLGEEISTYILNRINSDCLMLLLWSDNYVDSSSCIMEVGAMLMSKCEYLHLYLPGFSLTNRKYLNSGVNTQKMGVVLNGDEQCRAKMIDLGNKIVKMFGLNIAAVTLDSLVEIFIEAIKYAAEPAEGTSIVKPGSITDQIEKLREANRNAIIHNACETLQKETKDVENMLNPIWMAKFYESAGDVSSEYLQTIWSKILVYEAQTTNSFSSDIFGELQKLSERAVKIFADICPYILHIGNDYLIPRDKYLRDVRPELATNNIIALEEANILRNGYFTYKPQHINTLHSGILANSNSKEIVVNSKEEGKGILMRIESYKLSPIGYELLKILSKPVDQAYFEDFARYLQRKYSGLDIALRTI